MTSCACNGVDKHKSAIAIKIVFFIFAILFHCVMTFGTFINSLLHDLINKFVKCGIRNRKFVAAIFFQHIFQLFKKSGGFGDVVCVFAQAFRAERCDVQSFYFCTIFSGRTGNITIESFVSIPYIRVFGLQTINPTATSCLSSLITSVAESTSWKALAKGAQPPAIIFPVIRSTLGSTDSKYPHHFSLIGILTLR